MTFFSSNNITYMLQLILGKEDTNEITEIYYHNIVISFNYRYRIPANVSASSYAVTKHTYTLKINKKKAKRKKAVGASYNGKTIKTKLLDIRLKTLRCSLHIMFFKKGMGVSYSYSKKIGKSL